MTTPTPPGRFVKGKSGNPLGRGAKTQYIRAASGNRYLIEDLLLQEAPFVIAEVMKAVFDKEAPATAKIAGAKLLLEMALGKPRQTTVVKRADDDGDVLDLTNLDTETIRAVATLVPKDKEPGK